MTAACGVNLGRGGSCSAIGNEGGFLRLGGEDVVYSATNDSSGSTLHGVVVIHAAEQFRSRPAAQSEPPQWRTNGARRLIGGATVGPLWVGHEQATNSVWLDSVAVALDTNNVLLVEIDAQGRPQIAGQARIESRLQITPNGCNVVSHQLRHHIFADSLWSHLQRPRQVLAFLNR